MMAEVLGRSSPHRTPWLRSLIAADICADVEEQVTGAEQVQDERHFDKFMQSTIHIPGRAGHPAPELESGTLDPVKLDLRPQPARDLPTDETGERGETPVPVQWVRQDEAQGCGKAATALMR